MRQLGQIMNPRDERGWMVPREGTKRRQVYDALVMGRRASEIMQLARLGRAAYDNHRYFIMHWEKANKIAYAVRGR